MIWDGAFLPMRKHRDFKHRSVAEHLMDNGVWEYGDRVTVDIDPVTEEPFSSPMPAQKVNITYHGTPYTFLIFFMNEDGKAEAKKANESSDGKPEVYGHYYKKSVPDNEKPSKEEVMAQVNAHMEHRVEGGRRLEYYLSSESRLEELLSGLSF